MMQGEKDKKKDSVEFEAVGEEQEVHFKNTS